MSRQTNPLGMCRGCGRALPEPFLDLGMMPLANSYVRPENEYRDEQRYPLAVSFCTQCALVQLVETVAPETLFSEYLYFSSYSDSFLEHARTMAMRSTIASAFSKAVRVLEPGSNDGYLLQYFLKRGVRVLGVEPARNIAAEASQRGIPTLNRFFGPDVVAEILRDYGPADLIIGNNVLAHVPDFNGFLRATARCLASRGVAAFEFPYLKDLIDATEFDTIYHEHVFYFSLSSVAKLAVYSGLELFDAERQTVHGGSIRVFLQHSRAREKSARLEALVRDEITAGMTDATTLTSFGQRVGALAEELRQMLNELRRSGKRIAAYGAPAKGNTLLNYCGIGRELVDFCVDRSPHKQGLLLPGTHLPIHAPHALLDQRPDYTLILPWNIADEIVEQQQEYSASRWPVHRPNTYSTGS